MYLFFIQYLPPGCEKLIQLNDSLFIISFTDTVED